jgi:hypothetical protein
MFASPQPRRQGERIGDATQIGSGFAYRNLNRARARVVGPDAPAASAIAPSPARRPPRTRADTIASEARRQGRCRRRHRAPTAAPPRGLWPFMKGALILFGLIAATAVFIVRTSVSRKRQAERYAKTLATELDDRRKTSMAERQESGRRVLDLEQHIRTLEQQLAPRRPATPATRAT